MLSFGGSYGLKRYDYWRENGICEGYGFFCNVRNFYIIVIFTRHCTWRRHAFYMFLHCKSGSCKPCVFYVTPYKKNNKKQNAHSEFRTIWFEKVFQWRDIYKIVSRGLLFFIQFKYKIFVLLVILDPLGLLKLYLTRVVTKPKQWNLYFNTINTRHSSKTCNRIRF